MINRERRAKNLKMKMKRAVWFGPFLFTTWDMTSVNSRNPDIKSDGQKHLFELLREFQLHFHEKYLFLGVRNLVL